MERIEFDQEQIEKIFKRAEINLFSESIFHWLSYEMPFNCLNGKEVINQVYKVPMVYCIWISDGSPPRPVYVGQSSSSYSRQRLINHFLRKHKKTGAQLEKVMKAVENGNKIGVSFLRIEPPYMRKPFEDWLISNNRDKLIWNIHGKRKLI